MPCRPPQAKSPVHDGAHAKGFAAPRLAGRVSDLVPCAQCGVRYDPASNAFCPRCGSTAKGAAVPAALEVAQRRDPGRRRVQASGALLLVVGLLFLVSALVSLAIPVGEMAQTFVDPMANQPGGTLTVDPAGAGSFDVTLRSVAGDILANATNQTQPFSFESADHATLRYEVRTAAGARNGTAIVFPGDTLRIAADAPSPALPLVSSTLATTVEVGRYVFLGIAAVLVAGGASAIALRFYGLAATAAILGALLALIVLAGYLLAGLLFAIPFGFAAAFLLRGRRYFR